MSENLYLDEGNDGGRFAGMDRRIELAALAPIDQEIVARMSSDLKKAAQTMTRMEVRFLVDSYYSAQHNRIRAQGQIRAMGDEPHEVTKYVLAQNAFLELQMQNALKAYVRSKPVGLWLMSITGIGPVIAAGLLAHIDIDKAPTAGHVWAYAGFDPNQVWEKGARRPWNAALKRISYLAGESFVKVQANKNDFYGKYFADYKLREWRHNYAGGLTHQAASMLERKNYSKDTVAFAFYAGLASPSKVKEMYDKGRGVLASYRGGENVGDEIPMLPPAHIHGRARRVTIKLFLSHVHEVMHREAFGTAPVPYSIAHLDHIHRIDPPNYPMSAS